MKLSSMALAQPLESYSMALAALEESKLRPSAEQILAVMHARDVVQSFLMDKTQDSSDELMKLIALDRRLRQLAEPITQTVNLPDWRASLRPATQDWWWYLELPVSRWNRFDWLWTALTILFLTISLGLVADISSRFLTGGPDTWAALTVVGQSVLTLLAAGGALTLAGQEAIKRVLTSLKIPSHFWHETKLLLAVLVLTGLLILRSSLPQIAIWYNDQGVQNYLAGRLTSAQFDYVRAIKLNPDHLETHYNLGLLYEDLQQIDKAKAEYWAAVPGGLDAAHNNLGRLYVLEENYDTAVQLLNVGLQLAEDDETRYDLHKNLGWARLGQARYNEALTELQAALTLFPEKAPAHCLLAQVLERQGHSDEANAEWERCLTLANPSQPDEDTWLGMARERLTREKSE